MSNRQTSQETLKEMMYQGKLPKYTSLGSYTIIYLDKRCDVFCAGCATKNLAEIVYAETYDEGAPLNCEECSTEIESSYGNPKADENEEEYI